MACVSALSFLPTMLPPWIGDAIASVLAQTHGDWTLVVVDDGSTDGTGEVVTAISPIHASA